MLLSDAFDFTPNVSFSRAKAWFEPGTLLYVGAVICVFVGLKHEVANVQLLGVGLFLPASLCSWLSNNKRFRLVGDTPTARIRSAAQGYVELVGQCQLLDGAYPVQFGRVPPCAWYKVTETEHRYSKSSNTQIYESEDTFLLVDDTGECVIDPEGAEVMAVRSMSWTKDSSHYKARYIQTGDPLYALGALETLRAADGAGCTRTELSELLKTWKQNKKALIARFDKNGDGEIDLQEWQHAVDAAKRELLGRRSELATHPDIHLLKNPTDRRPFLLSSKDPERVMKRYKWYSFAHLGVFAATLVVIAKWFL